MNEKQVLSALGDLTNGALNYYQATQTVMVRDNLIRNYIELLQKQNTELKDNWNKLRECLNEAKHEYRLRDNKGLQDYYEVCVQQINNILDKMQEIEGGMNE